VPQIMEITTGPWHFALLSIQRPWGMPLTGDARCLKLRIVGFASALLLRPGAYRLLSTNCVAQYSAVSACSLAASAGDERKVPEAKLNTI